MLTLHSSPDVPKVAFPSKIQLLDPLWKDCDGAKWFTGYDPPRTLVPVTAMAPAVTPDPSSDPSAGE